MDNYYSKKGASNLVVELSSRCNKNCWICGRRERDRNIKDLNYGDMKYELVKDIASQVSESIVSFSSNGEPTLYPKLMEAILHFKMNNNFVYFVTNGKLLVERFEEIIGYLDALSISIFEDDPEADEQYEIIKEFLDLKGKRKPHTTLRLIGSIKNEERYKQLNQLIVRRTLHFPKGSVGYRKAPIIPEYGVCREILQNLAIDRLGNVSVCVRFDPEGELRLGNVNDFTLLELWNSEKRLDMVKKHISGNRSIVNYCGNKCEFWGLPTC